MTTYERLVTIRSDVEAVEHTHVPGAGRAACARCDDEHPCRALACATWLRRLVLEPGLGTAAFAVDWDAL